MMQTTIDQESFTIAFERCASKEQLGHFVKMGIAPNTDRALDDLVRCLIASPKASAAS